MLKLRKPLLNDYVVRQKVRYIVNLPLQMAECEANYARLTQLLPFISEGRAFSINHGSQIWIHKICILERSPYTTTLQLIQKSEQPQNTVWLQMPQLTVRMYHDAKLAEVLAWEGHRRLRPRYEYPNQSMYQHDEKLQINQFLGEWLSICLKKGCEIENVWAPSKR